MPERARGATRVVVLALVLTMLLPLTAGQVPGVGDDGGDDLTGDSQQQTDQALPDLLVAQLGTVPRFPHDEAPFQVCTEVQNYGSADPGPFSIALVWDGEDEFYERYRTFPKEGVTFCAELRAEAGRHVLEVHVDVDDEVMEKAESNNYRKQTVTVSAKPLPDINVNVTYTPDPPRRGESLAFAAKLKNVGSATAGNFSVSFYYDDHLVAVREVPAGLRPNYVYRVGVVADADWLREGNHTIRAVVDPHGRLREMNEDNNEDVRLFPVPRLPKPELTALNLTLPASAREGETMNFTARVVNLGDVRANAFVVRFLLDNGTTIGLPRVEQLDALSEVNVTTQWAAREPGTHHVQVIVDADLDVAEDSEENNRVDATFHVRPRKDTLPRADLTIERVLTSPYAPLPGDNVSFTIVVHNAGNVRAPAANVSIAVDGVHLATTRSASLPPGGYIAASAAWNATQGTHDVSVVVDPDDDVEELDEANNARTVTFSVIPMLPDDEEPAPPEDPVDGNATEPEEPDPLDPADGLDGVLDRDEAPLVFLEVVDANFISHVRGEPDPRLVGRVVNRGNAVAQAFTVRFWLDGELIGTRDVPGLSPGRDVVLTWGKHMDPEWAIAPGDHEVRVEALLANQTAPDPLAVRAQAFTVAEDAEEKVVPGAPLTLLAAAVAAAAVVARRRSS